MDTIFNLGQEVKGGIITVMSSKTVTVKITKNSEAVPEPVRRRSARNRNASEESEPEEFVTTYRLKDFTPLSVEAKGNIKRINSYFDSIPPPPIQCRPDEIKRLCEITENVWVVINASLDDELVTMNPFQKALILESLSTRILEKNDAELKSHVESMKVTKKTLQEPENIRKMTTPTTHFAQVIAVLGEGSFGSAKLVKNFEHEIFVVREVVITEDINEKEDKKLIAWNTGMEMMTCYYGNLDHAKKVSHPFDLKISMKNNRPCITSYMTYDGINIGDLKIDPTMTIIILGQYFQCLVDLFVKFGSLNFDGLHNILIRLDGSLKICDNGNQETLGTERINPEFGGKDGSGSHGISISSCYIGTDHCVKEILEDIILGLQRSYGISYEQKNGVELETDTENIPFFQYVEKAYRTAVGMHSGLLSQVKDFNEFVTGLDLNDDNNFAKYPKNLNRFEIGSQRCQEIINLFPLPLKSRITKSLQSLQYHVEKATLLKCQAHNKTTSQESKNVVLAMTERPSDPEEGISYDEQKMSIGFSQDPQYYNATPFGDELKLIKHEDNPKVYVIDDEQKATWVIPSITEKILQQSEFDYAHQLIQKVAAHEGEHSTYKKVLNTTKQKLRRKFEKDNYENELFAWDLNEVDGASREDLWPHCSGKGYKGTLSRSRFLCSVSYLAQMMQNQLNENPSENEDASDDENVNESNARESEVYESPLEDESTDSNDEDSS